MATWDTLWWLILGLLIGWVGLWICDKLFLRDGQVAGLRAEREAAAALSALEDSREKLRRAETESDSLQKDLAAHNDQADVLRTELAVMRNERASLDAEFKAGEEKHRMQQQELDSARKLATERVDEIARLEKQIADLQAERDKAQGWAQGKEAEVAELTAENRQVNDELAQANKLLATSDRQIERAQRQARLLLARAGAGRRVQPRDQQRLTGRMRKLSALQSTIDALEAADRARRDARQDKQPGASS